jgi:hypothetical protein
VTDSLDDEDVERVDQHVDPTAVAADDIEDSLNDDFEGGAREAFAQKVSAQREPVKQEASDLLGDRLGTNPADGSSMIRDSNGQWAANAEDVATTEVDSSGRAVARLNDGSTVDLGTVDLNAGAEGGRDSEYSR